MKNIPLTKVNILGVKVNLFMSVDAVLQRIPGLLTDTTCHYICTVNPDFILRAQSNKYFKEILNNASLSTADGIGILYAAHYLKEVSTSKGMLKNLFTGILTPFRKTSDFGIRLTGVDMFYALCDYAQKNNLTIFLLGGKPKDFFGRYTASNIDIAKLSAAKLKSKYPNLRIVGASSDFLYSEDQDNTTLTYIHSCMAKEKVDHIDFFFVAYGVIKQENWIVRNMSHIPAKISIGVGGTFDFVSGYLPRSPYIFIKLNMEWLFRLMMQPWRIRRIFHSFILFPLKVFKESIGKQ